MEADHVAVVAGREDVPWFSRTSYGLVFADPAGRSGEFVVALVNGEAGLGDFREEYAHSASALVVSK